MKKAKRNASRLMAGNTLYFGDNLKILRDNIRDETSLASTCL